MKNIIPIILSIKFKRIAMAAIAIPTWEGSAVSTLSTITNTNHDKIYTSPPNAHKAGWTKVELKPNREINVATVNTPKDMINGKGITLDARVLVKTVVVELPEFATHYLLVVSAVVPDGHVLVQIPEFK